MDVKSAEIKKITKNNVKNEESLLLEIHNGFNKIKLSITGKTIRYDDLKDIGNNLDKFKIKGVFYARNCCKNSPITVLDSNKDKDKEEIINLIVDILSLIGEELSIELEKFQ
ncbi:hypothetical protein ACOAKC_11025 [Hathewaya histolytica]|uniref:hypothetical protein n=1 Tax=Hathewaya histolytica TaxID=1498 RepID=UPI003B66C739